MGAIGVTKSKLSEQRIIIFGAGSAGSGIATQIRDAMVKADDIPETEANGKFWLIDRCDENIVIRQTTNSRQIWPYQTVTWG